MIFGRDNRRTIAIGDIHGCALELEALINKLDIRKDDLVVFLGDYIDRGPDSRRVIDLILDLSQRAEVVALKGNHEAMLLDFLLRPESTGAGLFILNGGVSTLARYTDDDGTFAIPAEHMDFFKNLKLIHETKKYVFVHAGLPNVPLKTIDPKKHETVLLWSRHPFLSSEYDWGKTVIHGHTPVGDVEMRPNRINIDTGCVYNGRLTAIDLPTHKFVQIERGNKREPAFHPKEIASSARIATRFSGRLPVWASKVGLNAREFETLNYNQFGLLLRELPSANVEYPIDVGDVIQGEIGVRDSSPASQTVKFIGEVVRIETRSSELYYGVKIQKMAA